MKRKYLPELPELIDKLSIVTLKSIKLKNKKEYEAEAKLIMHDINLLLQETKPKDYGKFIRNILILMLANEIIWSNESQARKEGYNDGQKLLFTHSVNGIRMRAGNAIVAQIGGRKDLNTDKVNDKISEERGYNWNGLFN